MYPNANNHLLCSLQIFCTDTDSTDGTTAISKQMELTNSTGHATVVNVADGTNMYICTRVFIK